MISALLLVHRPPSAPKLVPDLLAAGISVAAALESGNKLVQALEQALPWPGAAVQGSLNAFYRQ